MTILNGQKCTWFILRHRSDLEKTMSMVDIIFVLHGLITHMLNGGFNLCIVLLLTLLKHLNM